MFAKFRRDGAGDADEKAGEKTANGASSTTMSRVAAITRARNEDARNRDANPIADRLLSIKVELHRRLLDMLNLEAIEKVSKVALNQEVGSIVRELLQSDGVVLREADVQRLVSELVDEVTGLGPLEPLLQDDTVSDILVNTHKQVFVERDGVLSLTGVRFKDDQHLMRIIERITRAIGRRIDEAKPWVDARLADGSRVNALIPPCAVDGPLLSVRKFSKKPLSVARLIEIGTMNQTIKDYLQAVVLARLNVLISGGTGSGKTTTLNAMSSFIGEQERVVTIEDTAELQLQQTHVGRMESRPPNPEGQGEVTLRDLLKNALRMRPDRIIVGEVRGSEVLDMLQAMNTGHEGSMTTIHANTPRDALSRLENMVLMAGLDVPLGALRAQMSSAIHVIVQVQRLSDGARRITSVQELVGVEGSVISMQEIFRFRRTGVSSDGTVQGNLEATGVRSFFTDRFSDWGVSGGAAAMSARKV